MQDESSDTPEDRIHAEIRRAIGSQKLLPGTRLREDEMRKLFATSRNRIRAVLARLEQEGLVEIAPNRGASVARPTPQDARDLFTARRGIEAAILGALPLPLTTPARRRLNGHIAAERQAHAARDLAAMIDLSGEFHLLLASLAGNRPLERFLTELILRESLVIQMYERPQQPSCSLEEHEAILAALEAGDLPAALAGMAAHLGEVEERLDLDRYNRPALSLDTVFARPGAAPSA